MSKKLLSKYTIENRFHEWIEGFPENSRFENTIDWDFSFYVQTPNKKKKIIDNKQITFK